MKQNAVRILKRWQEVEEHEVWVVISTHATKKCAINMWTTRGRGFKVGFSADVMGAGGAGAGSEWYRSQADTGWGEYTAEVSTLFRVIVLWALISFESRMPTSSLYFFQDSSSNILGG